MDRRATVATQLTGSSIAVIWVASPGLSILPLGNSLSIDDLVQLGRFRFKIDLTKESEEKVRQEVQEGLHHPPGEGEPGPHRQDRQGEQGGVRHHHRLRQVRQDRHREGEAARATGARKGGEEVTG